MTSAIKLSSPATKEFWEIPVLFEDEHLLALDKPPGLLTSPDRHSLDRPNLMGLLHAAVAQGKPWTRERGFTYLALAHRLDGETGGVLLLARTKPVLIALADVFNADHPLFTYLALVQGTPDQARFAVNMPVGPNRLKPGWMRVDRDRGKKARTDFEIAEKFSGSTLLRCRPVPDRPHQIRVHLQFSRLPVAGDMMYGGQPLFLSRLKDDYRLKGDQEERPLLGTPALHAERLELNHPVTGQPLSLTSEWPKDLKVAIKYLRRYASAPV